MFGNTYIEAYKLESSGKGPRIFCNRKFVETLSDESKKAVRCVDINKDLYEIVWTYYACEVNDWSSNKKSNISDRVNRFLLVRAINLYNFYYRNQDIYSDTYQHYLEFIKLICRGILKYAMDNKVPTNDIIDILNRKMKDIELWKIENDEMNFLHS